MKRLSAAFVIVICIIGIFCALPMLSSAENSTLVVDKSTYVPDTASHPTSGVSDDITVPECEEELSSLPRALCAYALPSSYSAVDSGYVTEPKAQGNYGTCWAFSALSCAESSLIKAGLADTDIDLSESHLAYFTYHKGVDSLGLTTNDYSFNTRSDYLSVGGNACYATFILAGWRGAALESSYPYSSANSYSVYSGYNMMDDVATLRQSLWISTSDTDAVKNAVIEYGSVSCAYYSDNSYYFNGRYTTGKTACNYYCPNEKDTNHAMTIVGWDDTYPASNFLYTPSGDGAWLIKNSWGSLWGEDGYFWISYYDKTLASTSYTFVMGDADEYDFNYQYDGTAMYDYFKDMRNGGSIANQYTVCGADNESLDAVAFGTYAANVNYSIQIYKNTKSGDLPTTGTALLSSPVTGKTTYAGFYTVEIPESIILSKGDVYSVVITLSASSGYYPYPFADRSYTDRTYWINFHSTASKGQSFYKKNSSSSWTDITTHPDYTDGCFRIKAYTNAVWYKSNYFYDINTSSWYNDSVQYVFRHGYLQGTADGYFSPDTTLTRAMAVTIFANIEGIDTSSYSSSKYFNDVPSKTWYHNACEWAYANGVCQGTGANKFSPNAYITKQDFCVMLYNFAKLFGFKTDGAASISGYTDAESVSSYAAKAVQWAVANKLIGANSYLAPKSESSRAVTATMLTKFDEYVGHKWDEGKVITKRTSTCDGVVKYTCTECEKTYIVTLKSW